MEALTLDIYPIQDEVSGVPPRPLADYRMCVRYEFSFGHGHSPSISSIYF
jgi:hypothetical protein